MSEQALKILEQIRALPAEDQDWLIDQLNPDEDDPEFLAELERRSDEAHAHPERLVEWKDLDTELARLRKLCQPEPTP